MIDISVSNVSKEFEVGNRILDGLTFQVDTGERVGLLGKRSGQDHCSVSSPGELEPDEGRCPRPPKRVASSPRYR